MLPVIYILAEERSGSTWVHKALATKLGRSIAYIESAKDNTSRLEAIKANPQRYLDSNKIYRTHIFPVIEALNPHPTFIRTSRRNTLEQMLSYFVQKKALEKSQLWAQFLPTYKIDDVLTEKIILTETEINEFLGQKDWRDSLWSMVHGQTIYYEDLFEGVEVEGITLKFDAIEKTDNKKYFGNYEEIKRLVQ